MSDGIDSYNMCGPDGAKGMKVGAAFNVPACTILLAVTLYIDIGDWLSGDDFDWNYYDKELDDPDFCAA
jgi:hypothetical protein